LFTLSKVLKGRFFFTTTSPPLPPSSTLQGGYISKGSVSHTPLVNLFYLCHTYRSWHRLSQF
jgi:hypothetical protein